MKTLLPILSVCILLFGSCAQKQILLPIAEEEAAACGFTTSAVVQVMTLNEDGTDFFYYLQLSTPAGISTVVFPANLDARFKEAGVKVNVSFNLTQEQHTYVICKDGHVYDPQNPDSHTMQVVEICTVEKAPS
ncbi:MAG: hypothetical protein SF052_15570 [Bacteroidia bacterium]|nr:hypothetical protein [Bacteroidia bacterium]